MNLLNLKNDTLQEPKLDLDLAGTLGMWGSLTLHLSDGLTD